MTPTFVLFPRRHMCIANMWLPEAKSSGGWGAVLWGFKASRSGFKSNLGSHLLSNVQSICFSPSGFFQFFSDFRIWLYSTLVKSVKVKALVPQPCPTVCNPINFNPPGSSVLGILLAGILECVVIPFSGGSSRPREWTCVSHRFFTVSATGEALN